MKKLLTFFLTALLAFSVGWADDMTYTFSSTSAGSLAGAPSGVRASFSANANGYTNGRGVQLTSTKNTLSLTIAGFTSSYKLTGISLNYCSNATAGAGTLSAKLGSNNVGSSVSLTSSGGTTHRDASMQITETAFDGSNLVITVNATANSIYVNSIKVSYGENNLTPPAEDNWYRKVTSTDDLVAGNKYIIVNEANGVGMGILNNNRYGTGVTGLSFDDERVNIGGTDVMEMTLGGSSGNWTFHMTDDRYLSNSSSSNNNFFASASVESSSTDITKWTIAPSSNSCSIRSNYVTSQYIRYNSSGYFGTYAVNAQSAVALYVKDDGTTPVTVTPPVFSINGETVTGTQAVDNGTVVTITADSGNVLSYTTDGTDPLTSGTATLTTGNTAQVTITEGCTIRAIALDDNLNESEESTLTLTVNAPVAENIYKKVTSAGDLVVGKKYIIVNEDKRVGMGVIAPINGTNCGSVVENLTFNNNTVNIGGTDVVELTLGVNGNAYTFKYGDNNYLSWSSGNSLTTSGSVNNSSSWTVASKTVGGFTGFALTNVGNTDRTLFYNSGNPRFACYTSSQSLACLYVKDSNDPTLTVTPPSQALDDIAYNAAAGASTSGTVHVAGAHLTGNVSITYTGADFTVTPTTLTPTDGSVSQDLTVTYSGTSTEPVTCTITVTCGDLTETVTVTAKKATPPPATMTATPNPLSFGTIDGGALTVNAGYLDANVNLSILNTNYSTNTDKWTVNPTTIATADGSVVETTATVNYSGRLLKSDNTVRVSTTTSGVADIDVPVHYKHNGPVYIVTSPSWDFANGIQMGYENGVYTQTLTTTSDTYLVFAKKSGSDVNWQSSYIFGPKADASYDNPNGDWWLSEGSMNQDWPLDSTIHHTVKMLAGTYTITLDPETNMMCIVSDVHAPVFSPEPGRYEVAQNVEITCDTPGAHIYYTTDGSTPDANSTPYTGAIPVTAELTTIKAIAIYGGNSSTVAEATYVIKPRGTDTYTLVTDDDDIVPFEDYVLVYTRTSTNPYSYYALSTDFNSSNYYVPVTDGFTVDDDVVTLEDPTTVNVLTLESAGNGQFYIKDQSGQYLYHDSGNTVKRGAKGTSNAYKWNLSIDNNDNAEIENVGSPGRFLQCNVSGMRYACYLSSSNIPNAKLYREGTVKVAKPVISPEGGTGNKRFESVDVTITCPTENVTIYYTTDGSEPTIGSAVYDPNEGLTIPYGSAPTTVKAIAVDGEGNVSKVTTVVYYWDRATVAISPASQRVSTDVTVTITSSPSDATVTYKVNDGEPQPYSEPFTVTMNEENHTVTVIAYAQKGESVATDTVTYTFKSDKVYSIAEFLALDENEEATFDNPVVVLFDYSQEGDQDYIWIKDRTGYAQLFIQPGFDGQTSRPRYDNGDVIPKGFKVSKYYYTHDDANFWEGRSNDPSLANFANPTEKALADPEQVKLSELISHPIDYNNRYLYLSKVKITNGNWGYNNNGFYLAADENGVTVADNSVVKGYNKFSTWNNKGGDSHTVTIPAASDENYYNVTFIFQKYQNYYEVMPIEFTPWEEKTVRLEELVEIGEANETYKISNDLIAARVTWDDEKGKFAIFAKDDEMYADKRKPSEGQKSYVIEYESQDHTFINDVAQEDYDQSNWIEILIPSTITDKAAADPNDYLLALHTLQETYENKILEGGTITGTYVDVLNPTIEMGQAPDAGAGSKYTSNIYCTSNFLSENLDADGAMSYRDDELGGEYFFFMDAKPQEFCKVVWAYYTHEDSYFVAPAQEGDKINGHKFKGSFMANMSLCEDLGVTKDTPVMSCFTASDSNGTPEKLYGFDAIVRKNPAAWNSGSKGGPRQIRPYTEQDGNVKEATPLYIVYPLNTEASSDGTVTAVSELVNGKTVKSVSYYNLMGVESKQPFEGINIVVTRYSDGSTSTAKVLR